MIIYCEYCGRRIRKHPRDIRKYHHHFCNRVCSNRYKAAMSQGFVTARELIK